jgi:excisionase family DNA binding protein
VKEVIKMEGIEKFVDVKAVAEYLSVCKSFVYKLVAEGDLPHYKVGAKYLFKLTEVGNHMKEKHYA